MSLRLFIILFILLLVSSCNKSGSGAFNNLEDAPAGTGSAVHAVEISSFTPVLDPIILTNSTSAVFGVTVSGNVGTVTYEFILDGTTTLQSGNSAFLEVLGSSLSAGSHVIKVVASNISSSAEKVFNVKKNSPTSIVSFTPALTGSSLNCGTGSLTFSGIMSDTDGDAFVTSWELDSQIVNVSTPFTTTTTISPFSELVYAPYFSKAGSHTLTLKVFDGHETTQKTWSFSVNNPPPPPGSVAITSFTPVLSPVVLTSTSLTTFGVTIADGAGSVNYDFIIDNSITLQSSATSFLSILGSTLTPGFHSLKVVASNPTSQAEKTFNLRKNTPPSISNFSPALTGSSISCSGGSLVLNASLADIDTDAVTVSWKLDNAPVVPSTSFTSVSSTGSASALTYTPDCSKVGFHVFELTLSDGYETFSQTWTASVINPTPTPGNVQISTFTPTLSPVVLTGATSATFAVSIVDGAGIVNYEFKLDNTTVLQTSTTPYLILDGSSLSSGTHVLKVKVSNSISFDEKSFTVRKNSPTSIVTFNPAVSGASLNCGTGSLAFSGIMNDFDSDSFVSTWELDSQVVNSSTAFTTVTTITPYSEIVYAPDCTKAGSHTLTLKVFDGYETTQKTWSFTVNNPPPPPGSVAITSFTPVVTPVVLTGSSSTTFGLTIADGAGAVSYDFLLDNSTMLQSSATSFLSVLGSTLTPGYHSLKVVARNATSQDEKIFNLRKNTLPSISTYNPALTGNTMSCSGGSLALSASFTDVDMDAVSVTWKLDNVPVVPSTSFTSISSSASATTMTYTPDCTKVGFHVFELSLFDGYETYTQSWTASVNNPPTPPGNVQISTFTPTVSPVVLTGATNATFAVSIVDGAGVVNYEFKLDNTTVLQSSTTPYLILDGSTLSVGNHVLKVKGSNSVSYDEKSFNIRRNALPTSVAYAPSLTGASVNCSAAAITFDTTVIDADYDAITKSWELDGVPIVHNPPAVTVSSNPNYGRLDYIPDCSTTGSHTMTFKGYDGYETYSLSWAFNVTNPAQESLGTTSPSGSNIVVLSTESTKAFTARASTGIPPYTFRWTIKRTGFPDVLKLTESNVTESSFNLSSSDLVYGDQTVAVVLTDSSSSNNPALPADRSWTVYKNQKPQITSITPSSLKKLNSGTVTVLSALVSDSSDTFTSTISRGVASCSTPSTCGLSSVTLPLATGTFSASFTSGTTFVGNNDFTLNVTDSHGESSSTQYSLNANYFSQACNDLDPGEICTLAGMPGIGDELDLTIAGNSSKVRIHPSMMSVHNLGLTRNNIFITDMGMHVVWYWNRQATSFQLGPYTIPANSIKSIIGVPGFSTTISAAASFGTLTTTQLGNFFLNTPTGVTNTTSGTGSSMVTNLYIGESSANRVLRIQFNNASSSASVLPSAAVLGCGASTNLLDVEVDTSSAPNKLYATCNNNSVLRNLDLSSASAFATTAPTAFVVVATGAGTPYSDGAIPGTAFTGQVGGLAFDPVDKLLYFTETNTCRLRVLNPAGNGTVNLLDSFSIAGGNIKTISGGLNGATWCANPLGYYGTTTTTQFGALRGVQPYRVSGVLKGFFVSDTTYHRVVFINQSASTITIGNRAVPAYNAGIVFGLNNMSGAANNNGTLLGGKGSSLNSPWDIALDGGVLYVSDYGNSRIRSLIIDDNAATPAITANGTVATAIGSIPKAGYNESPTLQAQNVQFNTPQTIKYDSTNNRLLISDSLNYRIRSLSLATGVVDTLIGSGTYADQINQANPLQLSMRGPHDIDIHKYAGSEFPIFADSILGNGGAFNNIIRTLNSYGDIENVVGTDTDAGKTNVIAGIQAATTWAGANFALFNNQPAVITPINNPSGLGSDGPGNILYVASYTDHCIHKIDGSGIISMFAGLCGTSGTTSGSLATARFTNPWDLEMDTLYPGNFFIIDSTSSATSLLKYVNTSSTPRSILGTIVGAYSVEALSLAPGPNFANAVAVNNDQVCFANGRFIGPLTTQFATQSVICYARAGSGSLSLYVGNRNNPGLGTPIFRGRSQKYDEDEGIGMGYGGLDPVNNPVQLGGPEGLAFDANGNLYISEAKGQSIRMVKKWW